MIFGIRAPQNVQVHKNLHFENFNQKQYFLYLEKVKRLLDIRLICVKLCLIKKSKYISPVKKLTETMLPKYDKNIHLQFAIKF